VRSYALILAVAVMAANSGCARTPPAKAANKPVTKAPKEMPKELNESSIRQIVRENMSEFRACYMDVASRHAGLEGRLAVALVIAADGGVASAADVHDVAPSAEFALTDFEMERRAPRFPDAKVTACVVREFRSLRFPKPKPVAGSSAAPSLTLVYPLIFKPE
jgi:hypothetical protein